MRKIIVFPGQKVVTTGGEVVTVSHVAFGQIFVIGRNGLPKAAQICTDAFGGEHDQTLGMVA